MKSIFVSDNDLLGRFVADDVVNMSTGEVYVEAGDERSEDTLAKLAEAGIQELGILFIDNVSFGPFCATRWQLTVTHAVKMRWLIFTG